MLSSTPTKLREVTEGYAHPWTTTSTYSKNGSAGFCVGNRSDPSPSSEGEGGGEGAGKRRPLRREAPAPWGSPRPPAISAVGLTGLPRPSTRKAVLLSLPGRQTPSPSPLPQRGRGFSKTSLTHTISGRAAKIILPTSHQQDLEEFWKEAVRNSLHVGLVFGVLREKVFLRPGPYDQS